MRTVPPLSRTHRIRLLELAREAMSERLTRGNVPSFDVPDPALNAPAGAFVTLLLEGQLRGCVGTVDADMALWRAVVAMAVGTATSDPAFPPLTTRELARCDIEISVLSPFAPIAADAIVPGRHGLYLVRGPKRSVLLPQVATQYRWDRKQLLQQLSTRAGLDKDAWKSNDVRLFAFEADVFSDISLSGH
jgi:AmmeMemoRadiSam system protein A